MSARTGVVGVLLSGYGTAPVGRAYQKRVNESGILPDEKGFSLQMELLKLHEGGGGLDWLLCGVLLGIMALGILCLAVARHWFIEVFDLDILSYGTSGMVPNHNGWGVSNTLFFMPVLWLFGGVVALAAVIWLLWWRSEKERRRRRDRRLALHFVELVEKVEALDSTYANRSVLLGEMKPETRLRDLAELAGEHRFQTTGDRERNTDRLNQTIEALYELGMIPNKSKKPYFPVSAGDM